MRPKSIAYWTATILVAILIGSGGITQALQLKQNVDGMRALGYPAYFLTILGIWKLLGAIAIIVPRFPRLKEWAYAGIIFDLTGAAASWAAVGGPGEALHIIAPLIIAALTLASWALRPPTRIAYAFTPSPAPAVSVFAG